MSAPPQGSCGSIRSRPPPATRSRCRPAAAAASLPRAEQVFPGVQELHYVHSFRSRFARSRDPHLKQRRAGRVLSSGGPAHGWQRGACPTDPGLPGVPRGMGGRWARRVRAHDQVGLRVPGSCFRQELRAGPGRGTGYFERAQLAGLRHRNTLYVCGLRVARGSPRARVACAASLSGRVLGRCRAARPWHPGRRRRRALLCRCAKQHVRPFTCVLNCLQ